MASFLTKEFVTKQGDRLRLEREKILSDIEKLKADDPFSDPEHANDNAAIDTDVREQIGHDTISAEIKDLRRKLEDIDRALLKIEKGNYGICEKTGKTIPHERLLLVPEARYVVVET